MDPAGPTRYPLPRPLLTRLRGIGGSLGLRIGRPGLATPMWNLPARPRGFVGRDDLLDLLRSRFQEDPATPAVHVLSGPHGVGKTAAALEYAYRFAALYETAWWVRAAEPAQVRDQMVEFARALHLDTSTPMSAAFALRNHLRNRDGWLLVFDGAAGPDLVADWVPPGPGHVLITSRSARWHLLGPPLRVHGLHRDESCRMVARLAGELVGSRAAELAEMLGDLPLAIVDAAEHLLQTGTDIEELLHKQLAELPLPTVLNVERTAERLATDAPVAFALASVSAFLAPAPIATDILMGVEPAAEGPLAALSGMSRTSFERSREDLAQLGWAEIDGSYLVLQQIPRVVLRKRLDLAAQRSVRDHIESALYRAAAAADSEERRRPAAAAGEVGRRPVWEQLHLHILSARLSETEYPLIRVAAADLARYLLRSGALAAATEVAEELVRAGEHVGHDADRIVAAAAVAEVWRAVGRPGDSARLLSKIYAAEPGLPEILDIDKTVHALLVDIRLPDAVDDRTAYELKKLAGALAERGERESASALLSRVDLAYRQRLGEQSPDSIRVTPEIEHLGANQDAVHRPQAQSEQWGASDG